jgi:hypothetical protein
MTSIKQPSLFDYTFNGTDITFERKGRNVMVNATAMAKIFGKEVKHFNENESTKRFIQSCLKSRNSDFLNVESIEDLIVSRQKSGTWMHRVLALKFAAWLNPDFELWVYSTIDHILFGYYNELEDSLVKSADRRNRIHDLQELLFMDENYLELRTLEAEERKASRNRSKRNSNQMDAFRENLRNT